MKATLPSFLFWSSVSMLVVSLGMTLYSMHYLTVGSWRWMPSMFDLWAITPLLVTLFLVRKGHREKSEKRQVVALVTSIVLLLISFRLYIWPFQSGERLHSTFGLTYVFGPMWLLGVSLVASVSSWVMSKF
jgi:hypothetical protein